MSTYKDIIKPSLNERSYWDEHFWEMSKGMNNVQKKVLSNLIDEYTKIAKSQAISWSC